MSIGDFIHMTREKSGCSLTELSRKSGVSRGYLYMLEKGEVPNPGIWTLKIICDVTGTSLIELASAITHVSVMEPLGFDD